MSGHPSSIGIPMHDFPLGGTERIALRLAGEWIRRGVAVTIFVGDARGPLRAMVPEGVTLVEPDPPIPRARGSRSRLGQAAAAHFAARPVDALFVTGNFHWEIVPALAAIPLARCPALAVQISSPVAKPQRGRIAQWWFERRMRRLLRDADGLIALEEIAAGQADRVMRRPVSTAIPLPALDDAAPPPAPPVAEPRLLAVGRLEPQKDFPTLIAAMAAVRTPGAQLVIAGSGAQEARLRRQIERLGLADRIRLAGYVADPRPLFDAARLFVLSSAYEGFGAVLIEALAAGRPVVSTDCTPGTASLLEGHPWGRMVPIGDPQAMADAIDALLAAPAPDPALLAGTVSGYRIGAVADAYLALFARLRKPA